MVLNDLKSCCAVEDNRVIVRFQKSNGVVDQASRIKGLERFARNTLDRLEDVVGH